MAKQTTYSNSEKKALVIATLVAVLFGAWFLRGYFSMFVIAGTFAYLFYPIYIRLGKKMSDGSAVAATMAVSFVSILIPIALVVSLTWIQVTGIARNITPAFNDISATQLSEQVLSSVNQSLEKLPFSVQPITESMVAGWLKHAVTSIGSNIAGSITSTFGSFLSAFTGFIIYLFLFASLLKNGSKLLDMFRAINPLGSELSNIYLSRIGAMVRGTVQGQFAIAATQGLLGAVAFAIAGYGNLFFVVFVVFTLLSVIPLGAGIIAIPIGLVLMVFGNIWGGLIIILEHLLINTNVDNVLRPILVPKEAKLDAALMLISVFSGISLFGFLGIVIGPTIMIVIVTTIKAYVEYVRTVTPARAK